MSLQVQILWKCKYSIIYINWKFSGFYINTNGQGCLECNCHTAGMLEGTFCDSVTGQCECKGGLFGVSGFHCNQCQPGYYGFESRSGS